MELRGPHRHQEYPDHGHFLLSRQMVIIQASVTRKKCFLASKAWRTIPWEKHPETKSPFHQVLDVWAQGTGIGADITMLDKKRDDGEEVGNMRHELISNLGHLLVTLFEWRYAWEDRNPNAVTERKVDPQTSRTVDRSGAPLFETVLWYQNIELAIELFAYYCGLGFILYDSACLGLQNFDEVLPPSWKYRDEPPKNPLSLPDREFSTTSIASEIMRSVEYTLLEHQASIGSYSLLVPLRML
jgi:hypothetical protein